MTISVCMIVKNEEDVLERCLKSVEGMADEIIIVDTGSRDKTVEIARRFTDQVYEFPWVEDFSAARNFSFSKAVKEYCMWLDADDVIEEKEKEALLALKKNLPKETDVVMLRYHIAFDGNGESIFSYYRERIVRNSPMYRWKGRVHEAITPVGNVMYSEIAISHRKLHGSEAGRNLRIYEAQKAAGETFSPRDLFYYGRELYYNARYEEAAAVLEEFLNEKDGWLENKIEACRTLAFCRAEMGDREKARRELFASFEYDVPRAEVCCEIGRYFLEDGYYERAAFWYEQALKGKRDDTSGGFVLPDCYGYLPCIQLCVCYDRLGQREKAIKYNDRAGKYKPESEAFLINKAYFKKDKSHDMNKS